MRQRLLMSAPQHTLESLKGTELFSRLLDFGRERSFEEGHALAVTALSLELFDLLAPVHRMGDGERRLLFSAAMLHDVGMCRGIRGHHKSSLDIIMAGDLHPLTDSERRLVAGIARYHRKAHPKRKHDHFSALKEDEQAAVCGAASILRIADALDRAHENAVLALEVEMSTRKVLIKAVSARELSFEEEALRKKGRLFEELFGLRLSLEAVRPQV
jgi:exopolyphosphatase/guanosine-5'-triphosphate,3'-diphosphate pyrophosphatase